MNITLRKFMTIGFSAIALSTLSISAIAAPVIVNGGFELSSGNSNGNAAGTGQLNYNGFSETGWTNGHDGSGHLGYNFIFRPNASGNTAAVTGNQGAVALYGPIPASPNGGDFLAADSDYQTAGISQTVTGLVVGQTYAISFYWGLAQQVGFNGPTTDAWTVTLGTQSHSTATVNDPTHTFTGWFQETFNYTATATSETLTFLASGGPSGTVPPFALLDGVSIATTTGAPEPGAFGLMLTGLIAGIGALKLKNRSKV